MTADDLDTYMRGLGLSVEIIQDRDGQAYSAVRDLVVTTGSLAGRTCDVAMLRPTAEPYVPAAAIHVRPHLVQMGTAATQASSLGDDWQYVSRRYDRSPTPKGIWTHILTVLGEL